jgi:hypothetical protein
MWVYSWFGLILLTAGSGYKSRLWLLSYCCVGEYVWLQGAHELWRINNKIPFNVWCLFFNSCFLFVVSLSCSTFLWSLSESKHNYKPMCSLNFPNPRLFSRSLWLLSVPRGINRGQRCQETWMTRQGHQNMNCTREVWLSVGCFTCCVCCGTVLLKPELTSIVASIHF